MPDHKETLIRIDHTTKTVEVWSEVASLTRRLLRLGYKESKRQGRGVWLSAPAKAISFRKVRQIGQSGATKAQLEALAKAQAARKAS